MKTKKRCSRCGETKPLHAFNKMARSPDGLQNYCRQCKAEAQKEYRATPRGRQLKREAAARYFKSNKGKAAVKKCQDKRKERIPPAVYQIRCLVNNRVYIGETTFVLQRELDHMAALKRKAHSNPYLQDDYNQYGPDAFVFEILECPKEEALRDCEQYWIKRSLSNCYNCCHWTTRLKEAARIV